MVLALATNPPDSYASLPPPTSPRSGTAVRRARRAPERCLAAGGSGEDMMRWRPRRCCIAYQPAACCSSRRRPPSSPVPARRQHRTAGRARSGGDADRAVAAGRSGHSGRCPRRSALPNARPGVQGSSSSSRPRAGFPSCRRLRSRAVPRHPGLHGRPVPATGAAAEKPEAAFNRGAGRLLSRFTARTGRNRQHRPLPSRSTSSRPNSA